MVVKPGIKKLAIHRSKELNRERKGELNLLLICHAYLARRFKEGDLSRYGELRCVQVQIEQWSQLRSEKILIQSRSDEVSCNERVRIYNQDLHEKQF